MGKVCADESSASFKGLLWLKQPVPLGTGNGGLLAGRESAGETWRINLLLRLYAEVADGKETEQLTQAILPVIEKQAQVQEQVIEPYWKIPGYYGIALHLTPKADSKKRFLTIWSLYLRRAGS